MTTVGTKYRGTTEYHLTFCALVTPAQHRGVVYYVRVARILGIMQTGHHMAREVGQILGEISEDEHRTGRPMLSAVAIAFAGRPGEGFFELARNLGKLFSTETATAEQFWLSEHDSVYRTWAVES